MLLEKSGTKRNVNFGFGQKLQMVVNLTEDFFQFLALCLGAHCVVANGQTLHFLLLLGFRCKTDYLHINLLERENTPSNSVLYFVEAVRSALDVLLHPSTDNLWEVWLVELSPTPFSHRLSILPASLSDCKN